MWEATLGTDHKLELEVVLGFAEGVLDFLGEDEAHFEEEQVALTAFFDELLGVPDRELLLKEHLSKSIQALLPRGSPMRKWSEEEVTRGSSMVKRSGRLTSSPSSIDKCMASLAFFGTFNMTSRPSCNA